MVLGGSFPRSFVEDVRNSADIVGLVSEYVPLKKAGQRYKGLCPFHQEKTPSFSVDPSRQLFYCFGCGTGGDIFKFVQLYEKVDFREAAEQLARRFGVALPAPTRAADSPRDRVLEINALAVKFFRDRLADDAGKGCRAYLERRGLEDKTIEHLALGYAPDSWEALRTHLLAKRFTAQELVRAGLTLKRKSGQGEYDRFRDRLIFPINDAGGRTVAFGGRALGDAEPKYMNSPETPAYIKSEHLYGLDLSREAIRREGVAVIVEGYMDLAALVQAGVDNVVASLGTAFTPQQARLLARYADRVVFSYDGDAAGATATVRSMDLLLERGFTVRVVELPGGMDPDDYIRQEGAAAYARLVREAPEYLEFLVQREARGRNLGRVEEQVAAVNAVLPHLARLGNTIERASWAGRLADALHIEDDLVLQELGSALRSQGKNIRQRPQKKRPPAAAEARLVALMLDSADAREEAAATLQADDLLNTRVEPIVKTILKLEHDRQPVSYPVVLDELENETDRELLTSLAFRDEPEDGPAVADCLWTLRHRRLVKQGHEEASRIADLQKTSDRSDSAEVDDRLIRLQELARQRDSMS